MSIMGVAAFDSTIQKTGEWLRDIMEEMGSMDEHRAYLALRSVLHALRDRLTVEEAADLGAQLPMLVRGFYYDGWKPGNKPLKEKHLEQFLAHISHDFRNEPDVDAQEVANAVFAVLAKKITGGEIQDIRNMLPEEIRSLWPQQQEAGV